MPDPAQLTMGQRSDAATIAQIRQTEHLDKPMWQQFAYYLNDLSPIAAYPLNDYNAREYRYRVLWANHNNSWGIVAKMPYLRRSFQSHRRVSEILTAAIPTTFVLAIAAILLAGVLGIGLGIIAALKQNTWLDWGLIAGSVVGISQPSYVTAVILATVLGYWLHDFTHLSPSGALLMLNDYGNTVVQWQNLILPALALGIRPVAIILQLCRSSMLDVLQQDYIRTARAKGLSEKIVLVKHALRNALIPVVTALSGWLAAVLTGAYFVEIIFDCKGLGFVTVNALNVLDFPVVMGSVLLTASIFIVINFCTDILYSIIDPRIRLYE